MNKLRSKRLPTFGRAGRWLLAAALSACCPTWAQESLPLSAENLEEQAVSVPGDLPANAILLVGFSRDANAEVRAWWEALQAARAERGITPYNVSIIEGAPGFAQDMLRRAMRERAPASRRDYILLVTEGADAWRSFVGAEDDAAAHVLRLDDGGGICLQRTGPLTDDALLAIVAGDCENAP